MSRVDDNKAIVGRWFTHFWGKEYNAAIVDELAAPDMLLQYSLHAPRRGRDDIKAFMKDFRKAFPDLNFWGTADLIAEGDYVVGRWEGRKDRRGDRAGRWSHRAPAARVDSRGVRSIAIAAAAGASWRRCFSCHLVVGAGSARPSLVQYAPQELA